MRAKLGALTAILLITAPLYKSFGAPVSSYLSIYQYKREYQLLERAKEIGLIKEVDLSFKPLTRIAFAKAIVEIYNNREISPETAKRIFDQLYPEFKEDVDKLLSSEKDQDYIKPLRNIYVETITLSGNSKYKLPYSEGFKLEEGGNFRLNVSSEVKYSKVLLFLEPELRQDNLRLNRAYVTWNSNGVNFLFGRESVSWGNAENGDLLFTNNIRPWLMFKVENDSYKKFPWIFEKLGEYRFSTFFSQLEKERKRSYAHVLGMRLAWRPLHNLEIAGTRAIQFGGTGRPNYTSLHDYWKLFTASDENVKDPNPEAHKYDNNQMASIDITYYMDWLNKFKFQPFKGGKIYYVYAGDDAVKPVGPGGLPLPTAAAHIFGVAATTGTLDLKYEYSETVDNEATWYTHHMYPDGYTYHGFIIGNFMGGAAKSYYYSISRDFSWGNLKFSYNYVKRGITISPNIEKNRLYSLEIEKHLSYENLFNFKIHNCKLYAGFTYNNISNFNYSKEDKKLYIFNMGTNISF